MFFWVDGRKADVKSENMDGLIPPPQELLLMVLWKVQPLLVDNPYIMLY